MTIEKLKSHAATELEQMRIELAYEMGKLEGKQEIIDIINEIYEENGDE